MVGPPHTPIGEVRPAVGFPYFFHPLIPKLSCARLELVYFLVEFKIELHIITLESTNKGLEKGFSRVIPLEP